MTQANITESNNILDKIAQMSFEEALAHLETVVKRLENGTQNLDQAIADYELGTALKTHCKKKLREASLKVEQIVQNEEGYTTEEIEVK